MNPPEPRMMLGEPAGDRVAVVPTRYEFPESTDYWDSNSVYADITIVAGAFRGGYEALVRTEEFLRFRRQLGELHETLKGEAVYETMEHWLKVTVVGDGLGHLTAKCVARDELGTGSQLTFEVSFDQTFVPAILRDLDELIRVFPVRGRQAS